MTDNQVSKMSELQSTSPQKMLEDAFRAIYERDKKDEISRVEEEEKRSAYQVEWCNKFKDIFSFVSQYGGRIDIHTESDFAVKFHHVDKSIVIVVSESGGYSMEIHPPEPNSDKCLCRENYLFDVMKGGVNRLTLPEITVRISKGLAASNADSKRLE